MGQDTEKGSVTTIPRIRAGAERAQGWEGARAQLQPASQRQVLAPPSLARPLLPQAARVCRTGSSEPGWRPLPEASTTAAPPPHGPTTLTWLQQTAGPTRDPRWPRMKVIPGRVPRKHHHIATTSQGCRQTRRVRACVRHHAARPNPHAASGDPPPGAARGADVMGAPDVPWWSRWDGAQSLVLGIAGRVANLPAGAGPRDCEKAGLVGTEPGTAWQRKGDAGPRCSKQDGDPFAFGMKVAVLFK